MLKTSNDAPATCPAGFRTTCWTDVLNARGESTVARESFSRLYQDYRPPLCSYLRRRGLTSDHAEELTQAFFASILEKAGLSHIEREGGRFRSFLLKAMQNFLVSQWTRERALKRGAGATMVSLQDTGVAAQIQAYDDSRAELEYDRDWAVHILQRARHRLQQEFAEGNKSALFDSLSPYLQGDRGGMPYSELAGELNTTEAALKVAIHRMRHRFGAILRQEIARTVNDPAEAQDELRHLLRIVGTDHG